MPTLTKEQLEFFHSEGYLHVPNVLTAADLDPVQVDLEDVISRNAERLLAEGKIDRNYAELPFEKRLIP